MRTTDQALQDLATRVGAGDNAAFRRFYAFLAPAALSAVRRELPDVTHSMHVVRATFCEVWWTCAFDVRCGAHRRDLPRWVVAIADRRRCERCRALDLIANDAVPIGQASFWTGLLADHDRWTHFELATMLDGHDGVRPLERAI